MTNEVITITNTDEKRWHVAIQGKDGSVWYGGPYHGFDEALRAAERGHGEIQKMLLVRDQK